MIVNTPSKTATMLAGSIQSKPISCSHMLARRGEPTVAVIGAGKMGLPLCAQFISHGWKVIAADNNPEVVASINAGKSHIGDEPGVDTILARAVEVGMLQATGSIVQAVRQASVVIVIIPVGLRDGVADFQSMDTVVHNIGMGLRPGMTIIFETTVPVGTTRNRYTPILEQESGLRVEEDFYVAFSPERVSSGSVLVSLGIYPKLVGGVGPNSGIEAAVFYDDVVDAEIVLMSSSEAAEYAKLMDTTYRDVNIALANEFADIADDLRLDVQEVIAAANSQPYSHVHQPGIGVGGHCIPVYPRLLMQSTTVDPVVIRMARTSNTLRPAEASLEVLDVLGETQDLVGYKVLVLGVTYRHGVKELSFSPALDVLASFKALGATVYAWDPLLTADEVRALGVEAWEWGNVLDADAIVSTTADPAFEALDVSWFPNLNVLYDGRNSLRKLTLPEHVEYVGIGVHHEDR